MPRPRRLLTAAYSANDGVDFTRDVLPDGFRGGPDLIHEGVVRGRLDRNQRATKGGREWMTHFIRTVSQLGPRSSKGRQGPLVRNLRLRCRRAEPGRSSSSSARCACVHRGVAGCLQSKRGP